METTKVNFIIPGIVTMVIITIFAIVVVYFTAIGLGSDSQNAFALIIFELAWAVTLILAFARRLSLVDFSLRRKTKNRP